jgi:D-alanyl-D-alanine dipeptidase
MIGFMLSAFAFAGSAKLKDSDFVRVKDHIPTIYVDLRYASERNFMRKKVYNFHEAYLRYGTVKKLKRVQEALIKKGYSLKIWDAFRPTYAQWELWKVTPDARYVANPNKTFSPHSKGHTVDITMVSLDGAEIPMPTEFDTFTAKADRDYSDLSPEERRNGKILEDEMIRGGFKGNRNEWWHYSDAVQYPVEKIFVPAK